MLPLCAFFLVGCTQRQAISSSEISLLVVKGCVLRCFHYLKVFYLISDRSISYTKVQEIPGLCCAVEGEPRWVIGKGLGAVQWTSWQEGNPGRVFMFMLFPCCTLVISLPPVLHFLLSTMFSTLRCTQDLQVPQLTEMRRKVTQSLAFQCTAKSSLFSLLREIWGRCSEESQLWLSSKCQAWGKSSMDRQLPEWATQGRRQQRMLAGQEEGGGCSGWPLWVLEGWVSFSLPWRITSYLRWRLEDKQSGKVC